MVPDDITPRAARRALSSEVDALDLEPGGLSRRRFLQAALLGAGGLALTGARPWAAAERAWAAPPVAPTDGILVNVFMYGGNDALNTVAPVHDPDYQRYRGALALRPTDGFELVDGFRLHPNLPYLHELWAAGQVAVVQGIGLPVDDLSHFSAQDRWMTGLPTSLGTSGWLGRWLDALDDHDALRLLTVGTSVPLAVRGTRRRAASVPDQLDVFGASTRPSDTALHGAVRRFAAAPAGRGDWHAAVAAAGVTHLDVVAGVRPAYVDTLPAGGVARKLALAARIINADIGTRVVDLGWGDFDSHRDQPTMHPARMAELDAGLRAFYTELAPARRAQVVVLVTSEFGRTPWANGALGTDHGSCGTSFLVGPAVRGGLHGEPPDLRGMSRWDRMRVTTDYRALYAEVLGRWLGADPVELLGGAFAGLDLIAASPAGPVPEPVPPTVPPVTAPTPTVPPPAPTPLGGDFVGLDPVRILDTRRGLGGPARRLGPGGSLALRVLGAGGVPAADVLAVAVNVTATETDAAGYLSVWPAHLPRPDTSSLNWPAGATVPNLVVCRPSPDGEIGLWNAFGQAHVLADVVGYFRASGEDRLLPLTPSRLLDTRNGIGAPRAALGAGGHLDLVVTGVPGSGVPAGGVDSVVLNVTIDGPTAASYLSVWPTGAPRPEVSSLNFSRGQTVPNLVIAKVGDRGSVSLFNAVGSTHVIADVVGCFASSGLGGHFAVDPTRVLDTRRGLGIGGRLGTAAAELTVADGSTVPATASGVVLNVTATGPSERSFLTLWPAGEPMPNASSLNYASGATVANLVIVKLGAGGAVALANAFGTTDVVADLLGYFA